MEYVFPWKSARTVVHFNQLTLYHLEPKNPSDIKYPGHQGLILILILCTAHRLWTSVSLQTQLPGFGKPTLNQPGNLNLRHANQNTVSSSMTSHPHADNPCPQPQCFSFLETSATTSVAETKIPIVIRTASRNLATHRHPGIKELEITPATCVTGSSHPSSCRS